MMLDTHTGSLVEPLTGRRWIPEECAFRIEARAANLRARGFGRGDRAFIHFGNCNEFFVELLAIWRAGGCAIPVDSRFTPFEIETLASWAKPRLALFNGAADAEVAAVLGRLNVPVVDITAHEDAGAASAAPGTAPGARLDDDALILFTSGTTGQPKGVVHTHRSLRARWMSLRDHLGLEAYARTLCLLPTHFGHGLICNCLFPWLSGCDLHILPPFKPEIVSQLGTIVDEHNITFMSSVPAVWRLAQRIAKPPQAHSLKRVFVGSAPLSASLWETVQVWSGTKAVFNSYGITETGSWLAGTTVPDFIPENGLVGEAWGGVIRVLKSNQPGAPDEPDAVCAADASGHVWVNTPALMRGYLDRDDLTEKVVSDGWFLTGDIGVIDGRGWLYLRGREREEINKGGMKVYPADIDSVIERFPATTDVCAFAFEEPLLGEDVGVAVVIENTASATLLSLYDWTNRHLARHQMPQRWYVVPEIPRTSRGKVNRTSVAEACAGATPVNFAALRRGSGDGSD
jgi:acyl-CoA synthetase (AMP-forming)/AMP-acid ligase II